MPNLLSSLRHDLQQAADPKTKESGERFFKEAVKMYGVKTATTSQIGKKYLKQLKGKSKDEIFQLCEELWQSEMMEESFIACSWAYSLHSQFEETDFSIFRHWVEKYVSNWASCDTLCNHTIGSFIEQYPAYLSELKKWTQSKNRWQRRAAAVTLIIPARHGKFLSDVFEIADLLLLDQDDLVQKGYGWMLKAASEAHQPEVFKYVVKNKARMPRTALRYAIEKMPAELKKLAMAK